MSVSPYHSKTTGNDAVHPAFYFGTSDPASPDVSVTADDKIWVDKTTGTTLANGWIMKIRASSNTVWTTILDLATTLALKANLASPTFTGIPAAPTAAPGTNTTQIATTAFVTAVGTYTDEQAQDAIGTILTDSATVDFTYNDGAPTITAIVIDASITGSKIASSVALAGSPTTTTQSEADNSTKIATTAYADRVGTHQAEVFMFAISDETTALTTGTAVLTFRIPFACSMTILPRANVNTVSSSGLPTFDIKKNGTTIFSTKITIDVSEKTSVTAATPPVLSSSPTTFADDDEITVNIDTAGTGTKGAKITLQVVRT